MEQGGASVTFGRFTLVLYRVVTPVREGDILDIAGIPAFDELGAVKWHLTNSDGITGIVTAQPDDIIAVPSEEEDETVCEIARIYKVESDGERTTIYLDEALEHVYDRATVKIFANAVHATHGETTEEEALGSGDGSQMNQRFKLKKPPLTYVSAPTSTGTESTLSVRVDNVEWEELPNLYGVASDARAYIVRIDNNAEATVIFGDGKSGARLPTGVENVTATYRSGIGAEGEVAADSLILLKKRPLGVREVTNPLAAADAGEPEKLEDARENAPREVLTMGRIVSLQDFSDFARSFGGIGKAGAVARRNDEGAEVVIVTVAGDTEKEISKDSVLYENLVDGIEAARDPLTEVRVDSFRERFFNIDAAVKVDSAYRVEDTLAAAKAALVDAFSFKNRRFAQPVTAAEVVEVIHSVAGVEAVDLNALYVATDDGNGLAAELPPAVLRAEQASLTKGGAELLIINETGITLTEMA
jgi:predicted phage baseplate assembly protein